MNAAVGAVDKSPAKQVLARGLALSWATSGIEQMKELNRLGFCAEDAAEICVRALLAAACSTQATVDASLGAPFNTALVDHYLKDILSVMPVAIEVATPQATTGKAVH